MKPDNVELPKVKNIYLRTTAGQFDVLGDLPGVCTARELLSRSVKYTLDDQLTCRVIDLDSLIAAKRVANRPKDRAMLAIRQQRAE